MKEEYKIKIGTDKREIPGTLLYYRYRQGQTVSNQAGIGQDSSVVEACRGLADLLSSEKIEVRIKSIK